LPSPYRLVQHNRNAGRQKGPAVRGRLRTQHQVAKAIRRLMPWLFLRGIASSAREAYALLAT